MLNYLKNAAKGILYYGGYYRFRSYLATHNSKRLLMLMYHDFAPDSILDKEIQPLQELITSTQFETHLKVIKEHYRIITVEKAVEEMKYGGGLKENSVALTIDDGYTSTYDIVFPLLRKYECAATVYIPTDWINGKMTFWWDDLADMVQASDLEKIDLESIIRLLGDNFFRPLKKQSDEYSTKVNLYEQISFALMQLPDGKLGETMTTVKELLLGEADYEKTDHQPLNWNQIKEMADYGVNFGGHTCSHINLSHSDKNMIEQEIIASKTEIESKLGRKIKGFAYPYGYDPLAYEPLIPFLKEQGFEYACTSWWGNNRDDTNPYLLLRNSLPLIVSPYLLGRELHINMAENEPPPFTNNSN